MPKVKLLIDDNPVTLMEFITLAGNKLDRFTSRKSVRITTFLLVLYVLDAWLLGSLAVSIKDPAAAYFRNPFLAAVRVPFAGVGDQWLALNLIAAIGLGILAVLVAVRFPELTSKFRPKKLEFSNDPACGTARWMPPEEVPKIFDTGHGRGILLGSYQGQPIRFNDRDDMLNHNVMIFGPPKSGKSWSEVIPNAVQAVTNQESVIMIDPKGEIARETLVFFQAQGYNVKVFNLVDMANSDRWNPLEEVSNDLDAQLFTQIVIANTAVPGVKKIGGDAFWDRAEQNLLKALTLYVKMEYPKERQTVADLYDLLASGDMNMLDLTFNGLPERHPAKASYNIYRQAGRSRGDIIQGLGVRLQVFQNEQVRHLTAAGDIDLEAPGKTQCAYFCVIPDTDSTFEFLSSLFFSFLFLKLTRLGDRRRGGCEVPVNFLLDEFCNVGAIPDFKKKTATMRSRNISCVIVSQSLPQLRDRYPQDAWKEILSCCAFKLFLGVADNDTAQYLSESLGEGTIEQTSIRRSTRDLAHVTRTKTAQRRKLMTLDEALRLDKSEIVLLTPGKEPLKINKLPYTEHPYAGRLLPRELSEYQGPVTDGPGTPEDPAEPPCPDVLDEKTGIQTSPSTFWG